MPNNRKPKLAPGSGWDEGYVVNEFDTYSTLGKTHDGHCLLVNDEVIDTRDALAAIRTAKLDPVFDSAVALAELWDKRENLRHAVYCYSPELSALLSANSAAVRGATDG